MRSMTPMNRAILLLVIQATLVLSIAGKYLYERKTCPRIWVRSAQFDPNMPLRGRYLALQLVVDACALPRDEDHHSVPSGGAYPRDPGFWRWHIRPVAHNGKLVPRVASYSERPESGKTALANVRRFPRA
jgi:hypothetical protein